MVYLILFFSFLYIQKGFNKILQCSACADNSADTRSHVSSHGYPASSISQTLTNHGRWRLYPTSMWRLYQTSMCGYIRQVCAVISDKCLVVISDNYVAIISEGRRPNFVLLKLLTISEPKLLLLRPMSFHNFPQRYRLAIDKFDF